MRDLLEGVEMVSVVHSGGISWYVTRGRDGRWRIYHQSSGRSGYQGGSYGTEADARHDALAYAAC